MANQSTLHFPTTHFFTYGWSTKNPEDKWLTDAEEFLMVRGLNDALVGFGCRGDGWNQVAIYDFELALQILCHRYGMTEAAARDRLKIIIATCTGPQHPMFMFPFMHER